MVDAIARILSVGIIYLAFLLTCGGLLESRFSRKVTLLIGGGLLLGIFVLQAGLLLSGQDLLLVLTILPLTAYLPAILCLHLLSGGGFFQTAAVWAAGLLVSFTLTFWQKLLMTRLLAALPSPAYDVALALLLLLPAALLLAVVYRVVRAPFREYVGQGRDGWLLMVFPMLVVFALLSYFSDSTAHPSALLLVLLAALCVTLTLARSLRLTVTARRNREAEETVKRQMALQRQDYETLYKKMELGRSYRHDLRHHLSAMDALLRQGKPEEAAAYIDKLGGQLSELEPERWCLNPTLNAVLAASISAARQSGCEVEVEIRLPAELPFDELDLCVILSNALENAVHACQALPADRRKILLSAVLPEDWRLTVSVKNPCEEPISFDAEGFPVVPVREGHGIGLRSMKAVAEKYHGLFRCGWTEGQFSLKVVLFDSADAPATGKKRLPHSRAAAVVTSVLLCVFFLNCMPALAQALEEMPVVGTLVRIVDLRAWYARWGDTSIEMEAPVVEGGGAGDLNAGAEAWVAELEEKFLWYVARKYEGYVGLESLHNTLRDDEKALVLRFSATVNIGGSADYVRYLMLDKESGAILTLSDLFAAGSDYVGVLSENVRGQMERQMEEGVADYFLPGGIWSDEECFQAIDPDQNFYVDSENNLVLIFDEYMVAPGSMGMPEFIIPLAELADILA